MTTTLFNSELQILYVDSFTYTICLLPKTAEVEQEVVEEEDIMVIPTTNKPATHHLTDRPTNRPTHHSTNQPTNEYIISQRFCLVSHSVAWFSLVKFGLLTST